MAARTWIRTGILAGFALVLPLAACQSVDVKLAKPRYATRLDQVEPGGADGPRTRPAPAEVRPTPASSTRDPVIRREPIITEETTPIAEGRGLESSAPRRTPESRPEPRPEPASPPDRAASAQPAPTAPSGSTFRYTVQPGDTVAGIGRRFGVRAQAIIELNGLEPRGAVRAGQALTLPSLARDRGPDPYAAGPAPAGMPRASDYEDAGTPPQARANPTPAAPTQTSAAVASRGKGRFIWPVRGDILARFGSQGSGLRNDGVNIASPEGTAVKAAAAGEVVYAGSVVATFGNMILLKHADGWVTLYGHLSRIDVKMRDQVSQGQVIGAVGSSGGVPRPQLHFEIRFAPSAREKAAPVDPLPILR